MYCHFPNFRIKVNQDPGFVATTVFLLVCLYSNASLQKSLDSSYTRMLRVVLNVNCRDHVSNSDLYRDLPKVSDKPGSLLEETRA